MPHSQAEQEGGRSHAGGRPGGWRLSWSPWAVGQERSLGTTGQRDAIDHGEVSGRLWVDSLILQGVLQGAGLGCDPGRALSAVRRMGARVRGEAWAQGKHQQASGPG